VLLLESLEAKMPVPTPISMPSLEVGSNSFIASSEEFNKWLFSTNHSS